MAIWTEKSVFYHIPKTGGIWVKEAMRQSGILYGRCGDRKVGHPFGLKREHSTPDVVRDGDKIGRFSFCFVRHPVDWLKSFWCYRVKTQYLDFKFPPDRAWDDVFERFVINMLDRYPDGFVTKLYQYYVGENLDKMNFIGRQENLENDLIVALTMAGEQFDEEALRATKWRNASAKIDKLGSQCILNKSVQDRVLHSEHWVMENFYDW